MQHLFGCDNELSLPGNTVTGTLEDTIDKELSQHFEYLSKSMYGSFKLLIGDPVSYRNFEGNVLLNTSFQVLYDHHGMHYLSENFIKT